MAQQRIFDYDVFLSYSSADEEAVERVAERLRDAGLEVWFAPWAVDYGGVIHQEVGEGVPPEEVPGTSSGRCRSLHTTTPVAAPPSPRRTPHAPASPPSPSLPSASASQLHVWATSASSPSSTRP